MSKRIGKILSYLIVLSMVLSCLTGLTINVSAFQESEDPEGDIRIYSDFLGNDLTYRDTADWAKGSYYSGFSEIEGMVYADESKLSYTFLHNQSDPQGPILGGPTRIANGNSDNDFVVMDMGWVLNSLEIQSVIATAEESVMIEYAEDDRKPVAEYGAFDVNAYDWKAIDPSVIVTEKQEKCIGEWDTKNNVRKKDRDILTSKVSKENMPENARYFKVYLPKLSADKQNRWRVILSGFGGTYDPNSEPAPVPEEIIANWPDSAEITVSDITETSATISWPEVVVTQGPAEELSYQVAVDGTVQKNEIAVDGGVCSMGLSGLKPGTEHTVSVSLVRYDELFAPPQPLEAKVKTADPTMYSWAEGAEITVSKVTQNTADISWPAIDENAQDITYGISLNGRRVGTTADLTYSFSGLIAAETYAVAVSAEKNGVVVSNADLTKDITTEAVPEGQTSVMLDTFNKEGITDPTVEAQRQLLFENIYDFGWDIGSKTEHIHDNTIFTQGHVVNAADGIDSYTLTRKEATEYNKNAYIVYEIPNADMGSFEISFLMTKGGGNIPTNATFEVSEDNVSYERIMSTVKVGEDPGTDGEYKRWTYTGFNTDRVPKTVDKDGNAIEYKKIKYLKINFPSPVTSTRCQSVQLEKVKINQNNQMNGWGNDAKISAVEVKEKSITISWPKFESDEDFEYMFSNEGKWIANLDKDQTSLEIRDLAGTAIEGNTEYVFELAVVKKNSDDPKNPEADLASQLLTSERIKTNGSPYVLVDKFKFSDSHEIAGEGWTKDWFGDTTPSWDSEWKAVQRKGANGDGEKNFGVVYTVDVGLTDFSVDFVYGNVGGLPKDSTFRVSVDGKNWIDVPTVRSGNAPGSWNYGILNFKPKDASVIPKGTKYLEITFGKSGDSAKRCFGIKLQKVEISLYDVMLDDVATFDLNQYLSNQETTDGIMSDFTFPTEYKGYPIEWWTSKPDVISLDGKIHDENMQGYFEDVVLTAGFRHNDEEEDIAFSIEIPVRAARNTAGWTDEQFVDFDFTLYPDSASVTAPQKPDEIYTSVKLPESLDGGSTFNWSVSDSEHAVIDEFGMVNFTFDYDQEIQLDLILAATKGSVTKVRRYPITLIKTNAEDIAQNASIEASSNSDYKELVMNKNLTDGWESAADDTQPYLQYYFKNGAYMNAVMLVEMGDKVSSYKIEVSDDGRTWKEVSTGATLGDGVKNVIKFAQVNTKYIRASFTPNSGETVKIASFEVYNAALTDDQIFAEVFNKIKVPKRTSTDLDLPLEGERKATLTWSSSNETVLESDGTVHRQKKDVTVTLTVTAELPNGQTKSKNYTVIVTGTGSGSGSGGSGGSGGGGSYGGGGGLPYVPDDNKVTPEENTKQIFADVPATHWGSKYINGLYEKGIVNGSGENLFQPENNVTREEFVKMVLLGMNIEVTSQDVPFSDVDTNEWYAPYVATAYQMGIIKGIDDDAFGVGQFISRQDMAVMADRILTSKGITAGTSEMIRYADNDQIDGYAVEAVQNLADLKVMNGDTNNRFNPAANATRAESAKIVSILNSMLK